MKRIVCLLLALVLVLALAGCRVSNRPYRRYATPYVTNDGLYDTYNNGTKDTYNKGTYRTNLRPRTISPGDAPLYDGTLNRTAPRTTGKTVVPSPASPLPTATNTIPGRTNKSFNVAS